MIRNDMVNYGHRFTEAEYAVSPEMTLGMDLREVMLSQPLRQAGYRCGAVGKWDSGRARRFLPLQRGFDFFYGFANTGIDYYTHERYGIPSMFRGNERTTADRGVYATTLFQREAARFLRENRERPFFLYLAFNAPHGASTFADNAARPGANSASRRRRSGWRNTRSATPRRGHPLPGGSHVHGRGHRRVAGPAARARAGAEHAGDVLLR